ncbi:hypothetical protein PN627_11455 [Parabacteroides distasonis]|nr:hypothetical protein [Parabacteroides distasonis]
MERRRRRSAEPIRSADSQVTSGCMRTRHVGKELSMYTVFSLAMLSVRYTDKDTRR